MQDAGNKNSNILRYKEIVVFVLYRINDKDRKTGRR
jgi:hypothetical protein